MKDISGSILEIDFTNESKLDTITEKGTIYRCTVDDFEFKNSQHKKKFLEQERELQKYWKDKEHM